MIHQLKPVEIEDSMISKPGHVVNNRRVYLDDQEQIAVEYEIIDGGHDVKIIKAEKYDGSYCSIFDPILNMLVHCAYINAIKK